MIPAKASAPREWNVAAVSEDVWGHDEIAARLKVKRATVEKWRQRDLFPDPDKVRSGTPLWFESTVLEWARVTGRL